MPLVYIHGVAVRNETITTPKRWPEKLIERILQGVSWETVEGHLRRFILPAFATDPQTVSLQQAYWGDLGAQLAWGGASSVPSALPAGRVSWSFLPLLLTRFRLPAEIRQPMNQLGAQMFGDIFCYLEKRGNVDSPGPIPQRILDALITAQEVKARTGEPIIVLTNSMGGVIMYDIVTYFLPRVPQYADLRVDYWCSVAAQIGLFEELKLFLCSSPAYGKDKGNRVPFPDSQHLGIWWNVWDKNDIISYSVRDIIEGVEDTQFRVGQTLLKEHLGYLQEESFYRLFAERIRHAFPSLGDKHT